MKGSIERTIPRPSRRLQGGAAESAKWLGLYLVLVTVPLFALLPGTAPAQRGYLWDFGLALGYAGLAMLGVQFALTARFRRAMAPFGIDIVYCFHRYLAIGALLIVVAHIAILQLVNPIAVGPADPAEAPAHMTAGRMATLLFVLVTLLSLTRRYVRLEYDMWRFSHAFMATTAFGLGMWHLLGSGSFLDAPWKQGLWTGYGLFWLFLIGYVRVWKPLMMLRVPWSIVGVRQERGKVTTLELKPSEGDKLPFFPGQFVWMSARASPFAMREHPFSIASGATDHTRIELSIKDLGNFTSTVRDFRPGEKVHLDGPYGAFSCDLQAMDASGLVFVAGGIGIVPILSMLRTLEERQDQRSLILFYGNRVLERTAFYEELERLSRILQLQIVHVLIEPPPNWSGEQGFVSREILRRHLPVGYQNYSFFLCGPAPMLRSVENDICSLGVPAHRCHTEYFEWV